MEAAVLGALFFLALFGPPFFGGAQVLTSASEKDAWMLVLGLFGAAGVGALLTLAGQALWEIGFPYGPRNSDDFRWAVPLAAKKPGVADEFHLDEAARVTSVDGDGVVDRRLSRHDKYVLATARVFYTKAPDQIVQWVRRRYAAFVAALSTTAAILLGVGLGLVFLQGPQLERQIFFDLALIVVSAATCFWALRARRLAREMEEFWYKVEGLDHRPVPAAAPSKARLQHAPNR